MTSTARRMSSARRAAKVTISLPADLLDAIERRQRARGETRSAFIREALERVLQEERERSLKEEREREEVERWIRSYREQPQTEEEVGWAAQVSLAALAEVPWEE